MIKRCSKCKQEKDESQFYRDKTRKDGRGSQCKECNRAYFLTDAGKAARVRWYSSEKSRQSQRRYAETRRGKDSQKHRTKRIELQTAVFDRLGRKCVKCGFSDFRALQIDHINGNGAEQRKEMNWMKFMKYLLKLSDIELHSNYQVLCANCNQIKKVEKWEF